MKNNFWMKLVGLMSVFILFFALSSLAFSQGKGKGSGKGKGNSSSNRGNSDEIFSDDKNRGRGKNDDNWNKGKGKSNSSNRFKGLSKKLGTSPEFLESRYELERRLNPDLTYGQFVAAHMIGKNHKGISSEDILRGLRRGDSIGQTLQRRGWNKKQIDKERKRIRKDRNDDDDDFYDDRDDDWFFGF